MGKPYVRLDKDNAAVLLVDHQTGLLSLVRDIDPDKFKNNVLALAAAAKYFNLPTILTTSFEQGPNGPLVPELKKCSLTHLILHAQVKLMLGTMKTL
jgi:Amidases related to nicotinamidase